MLLSAEFDLALTPTLEEALQKGIPLYFVLEFELTRTRWYWLDEKVAQMVDHVPRVVQRAHAAVPRRAAGRSGRRSNRSTRSSASSAASRRARWRARDALVKGARYEAAVRLRLDVNQLPKPFQVNALASREWQLASDWYRWTLHAREPATPRASRAAALGAARASACLSAIALFLLATATANTELFARQLRHAARHQRACWSRC